MTTGPLRVGVVGVGTMGADHADRIATRTSDAVLVAVSDPDAARAEQVAGRHAGVRTFADALELIATDDVEAVVVVSPSVAHESQVLACIEHGKPVLCEKPLAAGGEAALRIVAAERAAGRALVTVGFMRRFDPEYVAMKQRLDAGEHGRLLLLHNVHRNKEATGVERRSEMLITEGLVHEVDVARWLVGEEVDTITVLCPAPTSHVPAGVADPQVAIFRMTGGAIVTTEVFANSLVGYEVRGEAVAERGSITVGRNPPGPPPADFRVRFARAYDLEVQAWVDATGRGEVVGATAWDGYAATAVCTAGVESLASGEPVHVELVAEPDR